VLLLDYSHHKEEEKMQKFVVVTTLFMLAILAMPSTVSAATLNCKFKGPRVSGIQTIKLSEESLFINEEIEIPLEKSRVKCGGFGRQTRLDGRALGYQVILKTCSNEAEISGHLIDAIEARAVEVVCDQTL
jgi:hypothetical protein